MYAYVYVYVYVCVYDNDKDNIHALAYTPALNPRGHVRDRTNRSQATRTHHVQDLEWGAMSIDLSDVVSRHKNL